MFPCQFKIFRVSKAGGKKMSSFESLLTPCSPKIILESCLTAVASKADWVSNQGAVRDLSTRSICLTCERPQPTSQSVMWAPGPQGCAFPWAWNHGSGWGTVQLTAMGWLDPSFQDFLRSFASSVTQTRIHPRGPCLYCLPMSVYTSCVHEKGVPLILFGGSFILNTVRHVPVRT